MLLLLPDQVTSAMKKVCVLHIAVQANKPEQTVIAEIDELLSKQPANISEKEIEGMLALALAAAADKGLAKVVAHLLTVCHADKDAPDTASKITPLMRAIKQNHLHVAEVLLAAHADVNACSSDDGATPLCIAAKQRLYGAAQLLLQQATPDVNKAEISGYTPIMYAAKFGETELVNLLLQAGADPNIATKNGDTPLTQAVANEHIQVIELLVAAGSNIHVVNRKRRSPLWLAADKGNLAAVKILLNSVVLDNSSIYSEKHSKPDTSCNINVDPMQQNHSSKSVWFGLKALKTAQRRGKHQRHSN
jgi:ankyrin repeat protein